MYTADQLNKLLTRVSYKPGWVITALDHEHNGTSVLIYAEVPNSYRPRETVPLAIFSPVPPQALDSEAGFYEWLGWRLEIIEIHEAQEWFRVNGRPFADPHGDHTREERIALEFAKALSRCSTGRAVSDAVPVSEAAAFHVREAPEDRP